MILCSSLYQQSQDINLVFAATGSLLDYLRNNRMLLERTDILLSIIFQIVCAMKYLEEHRFIHRDLVSLIQTFIVYNLVAKTALCKQPIQRALSFFWGKKHAELSRMILRFIDRNPGA